MDINLPTTINDIETKTCLTKFIHTTKIPQSYLTQEGFMFKGHGTALRQITLVDKCKQMKVIYK